MNRWLWYPQAPAWPAPVAPCPQPIVRPPTRPARHALSHPFPTVFPTRANSRPHDHFFHRITGAGQAGAWRPQEKHLPNTNPQIAPPFYAPQLIAPNPNAIRRPQFPHASGRHGQHLAEQLLPSSKCTIFLHVSTPPMVPSGHVQGFPQVLPSPNRRISKL